VVKLLVGLLKGAAIGGAIGYGAFALSQQTGFANAWLTFGLIGALVGLLVGKPIWALLKDKTQTNIIAIIKAAFGFGVGCGLYALIAKALSPDPSMLGVSDYPPSPWPPTPRATLRAGSKPVHKNWARNSQQSTPAVRGLQLFLRHAAVGLRRDAQHPARLALAHRQRLAGQLGAPGV